MFHSQAFGLRTLRLNLKPSGSRSRQQSTEQSTEQSREQSRRKDLQLWHAVRSLTCIML